MKMIQTTQRSGLNVMFVAHGHMAPVLAIHQTITSMKRHLFVVNLYLWATDIYSYSKHSTHPKELYVYIYIYIYICIFITIYYVYYYIIY